MTLTLDPSYIVKMGYLVKSPPLDESTIIPKRWLMRWFVLYDDCKGVVSLYYYDKEENINNSNPKGTISLVGANVYTQRGKLHGFSYIINVQTVDRLYHLCSTQQPIHEDWLDKIRDHHIPSPEILRDGEYKASARHIQSRMSLVPELDQTHSFQRNTSVVSNRSVTSNSDDECDYNDVNSWTLPTPGKQTRRVRHHRNAKERPCPLPPLNITPGLEFTGHEESDDDNDVGYITMMQQTNTKKVESDNEGFGRSSSDSSTASASTVTPTSDKPPLRLVSPRSSMDKLLSEGFVGPKLTSKHTRMEKTRPVADIRSLMKYDDKVLKFDDYF